MREALELIQEQPDRPWSTAGLAARVGVSARTLQEGFASTIGVPPMTHLRAIRLDRIHAELSTEPSARITQAAGDLNEHAFRTRARFPGPANTSRIAEPVPQQER